MAVTDAQAYQMEIDGEYHMTELSEVAVESKQVEATINFQQAQGHLHSCMASPL